MANQQNFQLTNELANVAASNITFNKLHFEDAATRKSCWELVLQVIENTPDEEELNDWWRWVLRDAGWTTHERLAQHAQRKIAELNKSN